MIYIDPPYNTGKDFVYRDNFRDNIENYKEITGQINKEGIKLTTNTETNGRYHSDWLNMMYPRLKLARNLLTDDGVIFISIDDNEQANLKKICDEIFGEENFIADFIRKTKSTTNDAKTGINYQHEFLICYSKNFQYVNLLGGEKNLENYSNPDSDPKGDWISDNPSVKSGNMENNYFPIKNPYTGKEDYPPVGRYWLFSKRTLPNYIESGKIKFKKDVSKNERGFIFKRYKNELKTLKQTFDSLFFVDNLFMNQKATKELLELKLAEYFLYPKGVEFLKKISLHSSEKNDIILDFFSGSATTAHSVMQLNAEDGGNRKYIMVQLPEVCDESSEAYKAGYKNICEIGKERIRRAGEKIKSDESLPLENREKLDIGFKVFKLDSSNIKEWDTNTEDLQQTLLDSMENIKSDRNSLDVLYEILLKYGLDLNIPIDENKDFYSIGGGSLLVSLNKEIDDEVIDSIYKEYRNLLEIDKDFKITVILRDNSFKNDVDKTNAIKKLEQVGINEIRSI
ncbi:site-specific DNA-methyltransferase [Fusobacterium hwasookii]|uniref:site-specific DNA-methyltransferase n=2 Tax=Fusobacterium hwasookii TaxID=1583098 RepID=UPI00071AEF39|nr:site-specific DNA-methyltransferase [Fusobacterium hwasookii]ALQ38047.1 DNA methylase N-4 [Fusobacterium hwasookii ChDC F300]QNE68433.1 site-specific DNA-methyltransferase [Fusobacterium hwasookii]